MRVGLSSGDKNFAMFSLVGTNDPLFRYTVLSFLLAVNYSDIRVSNERRRAGTMSGGVADMPV